MRPAPALSRLEAAARLLERGPVHTLELARAVLSLSGPEGPAASAVFSLLGGDERFSVDRHGNWSLKRGARVGPPLESVRYAVVDVETTGGSRAKGHRITEVAVVMIRDGAIQDAFETMVNPGRSIPPFVARLTGITDPMVADAPFFESVAPEVRDRLEGSVFVAHNAGFDWGFVQGELVDALGEAPQLEQLCTVRLARSLLPDLQRRNLDALSQHFDILIHGRHRAMGDALATARIFLRLLDMAREAGIRDLPGLKALERRRGALPKRGWPRPEG